MRRLELPASCSQSTRSSQLSYIPITLIRPGWLSVSLCRLPTTGRELFAITCDSTLTIFACGFALTIAVLMTTRTIALTNYLTSSISALNDGYSTTLTCCFAVAVLATKAVLYCRASRAAYYGRLFIMPMMGAGMIVMTTTTTTTHHTS